MVGLATFLFRRKLGQLFLVSGLAGGALYTSGYSLLPWECQEGHWYRLDDADSNSYWVDDDLIRIKILARQLTQPTQETPGVEGEGGSLEAGRIYYLTDIRSVDGVLYYRVGPWKNLAPEPIGWTRADRVSAWSTCDCLGIEGDISAYGSLADLRADEPSYHGDFFALANEVSSDADKLGCLPVLRWSSEAVLVLAPIVELEPGGWETRLLRWEEIWLRWSQATRSVARKFIATDRSMLMILEQRLQQLQVVADYGREYDLIEQVTYSFDPEEGTARPVRSFWSSEVSKVRMPWGAQVAVPPPKDEGMKTLLAEIALVRRDRRIDAAAGLINIPRDEFPGNTGEDR